MRYSNEFKKMAVELYYQGKWPDTPDGISTKGFRKTIRKWVRITEACGPDSLNHTGFIKAWTAEDRYELVIRVLSGKPNRAVALSVGIDDGQLYRWVQKYKLFGYNGLENHKKGLSNNLHMKKNNKNNTRKLNESEYEELVRLRAEIEYIKAENEIIKKEIALREEKEAARLKAKKQRLSKNSAKRDTN